MTLSLGASLGARRDAGERVIVPYIMAGVRDDWLAIVAAVIDSGADAVEVGIPFSDPSLDGPIIQHAGEEALRRGTTPLSVLASLRSLEFDVPIAVMTYYNLIYRAGHERMAALLHDSGVAGVILPDLSLEESGPWRASARNAGVETVQLVAPSTSDARASKICMASEGFVYGVGVMGVTGERTSLPQSATLNARRLRDLTDKVVLIGIGVTTPVHAAEVALVADGLVVGSALMRRVLEGASPNEIGDYVAVLREAMRVT
ncbi:MAG: tryptophan synthase subunit alpha [Ferrimicrobium sp.]